jgi:FAD-linked sulfhydryl oxidase
VRFPYASNRLDPDLFTTDLYVNECHCAESPAAGGVTAASASTGATEVDIDDEEEEEDRGCPLDREELGRAAWAFLHTTAAYMPEEPTEAQKKAALGLVDALVELYPCGFCRKLFAEDVEKNPPNVESGSAFALWLCERHNVVNELLEKPTKVCTMEEYNLRWVVGKQHCYED